MELLTILNPWWKEGTISKELALPYRRKVYYSVRDLLGLRQIIVISGLRRVGKINFETIVASLLDAKYYWREKWKGSRFPCCKRPNTARRSQRKFESRKE
ncbi:MAG: hypothetical protein ACPL06_03160 [Candidatus Anstonellales archaeon]